MVAPAPHSQLVSARLAQSPDTPGILLIKVQQQGALISLALNCSVTWSLPPVPSWAVLLLSRSVIISAWMSLILRRSAARLYSICSICVRGITWCSCTWVHIASSCIDLIPASAKDLCAHPTFSSRLYLPSFGSSGNKSGKGVANVPLPASVKILTSHKYAHLKFEEAPPSLHFFMK